MILVGDVREARPTTTLPYKFEAGTPDIAGAIGLGAAIDYLEALGMERIAAARARPARVRDRRGSQRVPGLRIIGTAPHKAAVVSFTVDGIHPHDLGTILDHEGVAIRTGHHCAMPVMEFFEVPATARASFVVLQHARGDRPAGRGAAARARDARLMDLKDLYRDVIVDHNRNPRNFRAMPDADRTRRRLQSAVRRPADAVRQARRRPHRATSRSMAAAARSRSRRPRC